MDRAALYLRVSSDGQAGEGHVSLDVQRLRTLEYCQRHGWAVAGEYLEAESAFDGGARPEFDRLIAAAERGDIQHIVVFRADRFSRDAADAFPLLKRLERAKAHLHSTTEDLSNWLMASFSFVLAEAESRRISERVKPALQHKASQGLWPHSYPHPYAVRVTPDRRIVWDEAEAAFVRSLFRRYVEGGSLRDLQRAMIADGHPVWNRVRLHRALSNPVYIGLIRWNGQLYPGQHTPLVDQETFDRVQVLLQQHYRHHVPARLVYAIAGLARCGKCGGRLYLGRQRDPRYGSQYDYFLCPESRSILADRAHRPYQPGRCSGVRVRADILERWVKAVLGRLSMDDAAVNSALAIIEADHRRTQEAAHDATVQAEQRRHQIQGRLDQLTGYLLDGTVSREQYQRQERTLSASLKALSIEAPVARPEELDIEQYRRALSRMQGQFEDFDLATLREYFDLFIERVECDGRLPTQWRMVYRFK